jgi:hypothetical protein
MMIVLLIAGIGAVLAGIVAIVVGLPVKEFSFGNTIILAGVVGICTGIIVLALAVVVSELKTIARRLGQRSPAETRPRSALAPASGAPPAYPDAGDDEILFSRDQGEQDEAGEIEPTAPGSLPWRGEAATRGRQDTPFGPEGAEPAPAAKPRRNLMFSSSSRKERERAQGRLAADPSSPEYRPGPPVAPPVPEADEAPPPATFDDAWPKSERSRAELPAPRRARGAPSTFAETNPVASAPDRQAPPVRNLDESSVTVLKSGVVDGMAYSLYSDGSIEAQMPEGMMRFASIDDLRAHLDQRL